ncbi:MAG TPA: hypothetical protein VGQ76_13080 [Thermoanaerobaculia bacterium]|jgi:hypothetical protein|nr:hypothetical protein [Thermoanaerobaculia bacterium]
MAWERIGAIDPRALVEARRQSHRAAQSAAAVGRTLNPPRSDDSHTAFTWSASLEALLQEPVNGVTCGLRLRDLTILAIGTTTSELHLRGKTLDDAFAFFEAHCGHALKRPDPPVAQGAVFDADEQHFAELARYYSNAATVIENTLCWPHHFDIAHLFQLGDAHTIGVGLAPGDTFLDEPYFYVTPWPYPDASRLGELTFGDWNTTGWTGAVLPASHYANTVAQETVVRAFLDNAVQRSREALQ